MERWRIAKRGKIRLIGLSNSPKSISSDAARSSPSFLCRIVIASPTVSGTTWGLLRAQRKLRLFPGSLWGGELRATCWSGIARAHQATPMQVAIAWLLRRSPQMLRSQEHRPSNISRNVAALPRLTDEEFKKALRVPALVASR